VIKCTAVKHVTEEKVSGNDSMFGLYLLVS